MHVACDMTMYAFLILDELFTPFFKLIFREALYKLCTKFIYLFLEWKKTLLTFWHSFCFVAASCIFVCAAALFFMFKSCSIIACSSYCVTIRWMPLYRSLQISTNATIWTFKWTVWTVWKYVNKHCFPCVNKQSHNYSICHEILLWSQH